MTKLELYLALELLDKIIDKHIDVSKGGDWQEHKEIYEYEIEPLRNDIKALIKKIYEGSEDGNNH